MPDDCERVDYSGVSNNASWKIRNIIDDTKDMASQDSRTESRRIQIEPLEILDLVTTAIGVRQSCRFLRGFPGALCGD